MIDLGWVNGWGKIPELREKCKALNHKLISTDEGHIKHMGFDTVTKCLICNYLFHTDSSD